MSAPGVRDRLDAPCCPAAAAWARGEGCSALAEGRQVQLSGPAGLCCGEEPVCGAGASPPSLGAQGAVLALRPLRSPGWLPGKPRCRGDRGCAGDGRVPGPVTCSEPRPPAEPARGCPGVCGHTHARRPEGKEGRAALGHPAAAPVGLRSGPALVTGGAGRARGGAGRGRSRPWTRCLPPVPALGRRRRQRRCPGRAAGRGPGARGCGRPWC